MRIGGAQDKPVANTAGTGARSPSETQAGEPVSSAPAASRSQSLPGGAEGFAPRFRGIPDTLSTLISFMDRGSPKQKALISLLQLVRELPAGSDGNPLNSGDSRLLRRILTLWRERFGAELDSEGRGRMEMLEKQLAPGREEPVVLFAGEAGPEGPRSRLLAEEKGENGNAGGEEAARLVLDMVLPRLGRIRSTLQGGETGAECRIACGSGRTRRLLRKSLPGLRKRLSGIPMRTLSLGRLKETREGPEGTVPEAGRGNPDGGKRGIGLWG